MIYVYNRSRKKIGVLENALSISIKERINSVGTMEFELPMKDVKNDLCKPFFYVRYTENGELFRIMPSVIERDETGSYRYVCEHVIAKLIDQVLYGWHEVGNKGVYTKDCINYILNMQHTKDWRLGRCDFNRQFQYGWEQESLLSALFSIPKPITDEYMWTYDTKEYPWTLNLVRINKGVDSKDTIMLKRNMLKLVKSSSPFEICTRLYPLGYGEGVNQLDIRSVNDGVPYLQSPPNIVEKYGIIERVWVDRRYESAETLKAQAERMLREMEEPLVAYETETAYLDAKVGDVVRIVDEETFTDVKSIIVEKEVVYDDIPKINIKVQNRVADIAGTIADMMDRQKVETTYAQGATQIYAQSLQVNASPQDGAELNFYIPSEMRQVNKVLLKIKVESFRAYSKATEGGGAEIMTTENGGAYDATTQNSTGINIELSEARRVSSTTFRGSASYTTGVNPSKTITTDPMDSPTRREQSSYEQDNWGNELNRPDGWGPPSHRTTSIEKSGSVSGGVVDTGEGGSYQRVYTTAANANINIRQATTGAENYSRFYGHNHGIEDGTRLMVGDWEGKPTGRTVGFKESAQHTHAVILQIEGHTHNVDINIPAHTHKVDISQHRHTVVIPGHSHTFDISDHYHDFEVPAHGHSITDKGHSHRFKIEPHSHRLRLVDHVHSISPGIYRFGYPKSFSLFVNGKFIRSFGQSSEEVDITSYLVNNRNRIERGAWHSVRVVPNDLAYVSIDMNLQGFVQSRGGVNA